MSGTSLHMTQHHVPEVPTVVIKLFIGLVLQTCTVEFFCVVSQNLVHSYSRLVICLIVSGSLLTDMKLLESVHVFYVLLTVHPCTVLQTNPTTCTILLSVFIYLLYMFWATTCPSSGEITVSIRHWYLSLCIGGVQSAGWSFTPTSRPDATHTE